MSPSSRPNASASSSPLEVELAGLRLRTPVILAAGTAGYVDELADVLDLSRIGAVVTKSITREPREGNEPWRIVGSELGMLNAIGLANVGLDRFLQDKLPYAANAGTTIFGSVAGHSIEDYVAVASAFDARDEIPAIELNVSCPNTADGLIFGDDPDELMNLLRAVRPAVVESKLIVKLSPNAPSIVRMAEAAVKGGADVLSLINTFTALAIDVDTRKPIVARGKAGLSGPGVHPIAVRMVFDVYREVARDANVPIIAYGGVLNWQDAAEFILAGASAVGVGTALFVDPRIPGRIVDGLQKWTSKQGAKHIRELVGTVEL